MALVVRSHSDLVYLPDHGFVGEDGALRILIQITRQIHRLDISHNLLGPLGTSTLINGLSTLRRTYSDPNGLQGYDIPHGGIWGVKEMNLGVNALDDESLDLVLRYAKKDVWLERLLLQGNDISLDTNTASLLHSLNSSRLQLLSLTNNPISATGLVAFLGGLHSPHLVSLHLSTCNLRDISAARAIANFLRSPQSRSLENLELNGNSLGLAGIIAIVDAVEESNFSIRHLGLLANHDPPPSSTSPDDSPEESPEESEEKQQRHMKHMRDMEYQVHQRLGAALERNITLTWRIRAAAMEVIAPARILLHAQPPDPITVARNTIAAVALRGTNGHASSSTSAITKVSIGNGKAQGCTAPFRILDLPEEVLHLIIRHCSNDATAFSETQFARLRKEAASRAELSKAVEATKRTLRGKHTAEDRRTALRELRSEWLRRGRWDKWEQNPKGASVREVDEDGSQADDSGEVDAS